MNISFLRRNFFSKIIFTLSDKVSVCARLNALQNVMIISQKRMYCIKTVWMIIVCFIDKKNKNSGKNFTFFIVTFYQIKRQKNKNGDKKLCR